jgi:2-polyprenyl-6-methoxyphenol hydroxylase-like FAD-dependent oxidoreductase
MTETKKVLIIGAGTGGLALALFLEKAGIKSEIYEQAPEFSDVGASYAVHPNGTHVVSELGLADELLENSHQFSDYKIKNKAGETLLDKDILEVDDEVLEGYIYVTRYHLIDILQKEAKQKDIPIHMDKKLASLQQDTDSVTAYFEDRTEATGDILVGADGTNSTTREQIFPHEYLRYNGKWAVFGMGAEGELGEAESFLEQEYISTYFEDDFNLTISKHHPTNKERLSWIFIQNQKRKVPKKDFDEKPEAEFKQAVAEKFSDFEEPLAEMIKNSRTFFPQQIFDVGLLPKFSFGRVVLIGDALQTTDPYSGMGATLSLEDGMYLAKMLRDHLDYEDAFYYYEFDRKDLVQKIHKQTEEMDNIDSKEFEKFFSGDGNSDEEMENYLTDMPKFYWEDQ